MSLDAALGHLPDPNLILKPFQRKEASLSSKIEDTVASIEEIALMEADTPPERNEVREVWNNLRALEHATRSPLPISLRLMQEMHAVLLKDVRGDETRDAPASSGQDRCTSETRSAASATPGLFRRPRRL